VTSAVRRWSFRVRPWQPIMLCYLLLAVLVTWNLWADPATRVPLLGNGVSRDIVLNQWFMAYAATAVAHGHLPALVTTALNAPQGINAMWNTSFLLPGAVLAPLTMLTDPQVSLNVAVALGFFGSAACLFLVLRRWGASDSAAAIGGVIYGFSPALRVAAEDHYHLQFAVVLPLIVDAVLRLAAGRGNPVRAGAWLGVLISAQIFIAEEMLVAAALASLLGLVVVAASRPRAVPRRVSGTAAGFGAAVAVTLLLSGYALLVQFRGPLAEHGNPWNILAYTGQLQDFVTAPASQLFHGAGFWQFLLGTAQRPSEYFAYLGWPLIAVVLTAAVLGWRDLRIRVAAVIFAGLELSSLGGNPITFDGKHLPAQILPWYWLRSLPVLGEALPNRLSILADAAAAAVLVFALDWLRKTLPGAMRGRAPAAALLTAVALLPVIPLIPLPMSATDQQPPPPAWSAVMSRLDLPAGARVLVLPASDGPTMAWEADSRKPFGIIGGYCIAPDPTGRAMGCELLQNPAEHEVLLDTHQLAVGVPWERKPPGWAMAAALRHWQPAALVADIPAQSTLGRYLITYFGPPWVRDRGVLGWRL
jgi:hypothetical protein